MSPRNKTPQPSAAAEPAELARERLELSQRLAGLEGRKKVDELLDSANPGALVRSLPVEDLYFTIKEVGLEDAQELVQLASPTQFRAFIDLDGWRKDSFTPRKILPWLRAVAEDDDDFKAKVHGLDVEIIEMLLRETVVLTEIEADPDREPTGFAWQSPEGKYTLDFQAEGEELFTLRRLVDLYYQANPFEALRFMEAVRWELPSELEEAALRFRTGRLADIGFPEPEQALKLYAYIDPDLPLDGRQPGANEPPGFFLETLGSSTFFDKVLALLDGDDLSRIDRELLYVLNGALVADGVEPGQLDEVRKALMAARSHLSLGLEYSSGGDPAEARELLLTAPIARIFQVASGLTLKLKFHADRIVAAGGASFPSTPLRSWLDPPLGPSVDGLRRKRPRFYEGLEGPTAPAELRPFSNRSELSLAQNALLDAEAVVALIRRMGLDPARAEVVAKEARGESFAEVRLSTLILHSALQAKGETVALSTLAPVELADRLAWAFDPAVGNKPAAVSAALSAWLGRIAALAQTDRETSVAQALVAFVTQRAVDELAALRDQASPELAPLDLPLLLKS